jgi:hypothetical protein
LRFVGAISRRVLVKNSLFLRTLDEAAESIADLNSLCDTTSKKMPLPLRTGIASTFEKSQFIISEIDRFG